MYVIIRVSICFHFHSEYNIMFRHQFPVLCVNRPHSQCVQGPTTDDFSLLHGGQLVSVLITWPEHRCIWSKEVMEWYSVIIQCYTISLLLFHLSLKGCMCNNNNLIFILSVDYLQWGFCGILLLKASLRCQAWFHTVDHWLGDSMCILCSLVDPLS